MIARRISGGLLAIASIVAGVVMDRTVPDTLSQWQMVGLWAVASALCIIGLGLAIFPLSPIKTSGGASLGDSYTNNGINNGVMGPVHNYGRPKLEMSDAQVRQIISELTPHPGRIVVCAMGGTARAFAMGDKLEAALKASGRVVERADVVMKFGTGRPITFQHDDQGIIVTLDPNA